MTRINLPDGRHHEATVTTDSSASSYGQAVVMVEGEPADPTGMQITEVSAAEWEAMPWHWAQCLFPDLQD